MVDIAAIPWNGLSVISFFAGCGGSSLGYRMAGFRVQFANEFVPIAQDSYRANMCEWTTLDCRDIRNIHIEDIKADLRRKGIDELDILDGSPPCQAFSTAGSREKGWGKEKVYEHGAKQCNENLFQEYIRILRGLTPKVFVAENVSGLVKGVAKGFFLDILRDLKQIGYRVEARLLDAQWLGVPQQRQRVIFVGVREDLNIGPVFPQPFSYRYSISDACPWIMNARAGPTGFGAGQMSAYKPAPTVPASLQAPYGQHQIETETEKRKFTIAELRRICGFPDDFVLKGTYAQQWERLGNSVPPLMMRAIATAIYDGVFQKLAARLPVVAARASASEGTEVLQLTVR